MNKITLKFFSIIICVIIFIISIIIMGFGVLMEQSVCYLYSDYELGIFILCIDGLQWLKMYNDTGECVKKIYKKNNNIQEKCDCK